MNGSNADSVVTRDDGSSLFVKPYECEMDFEKVSKYIATQEKSGIDGTSFHNH
jgi:hypothetical protein